jgi:hypothetical protein
LPSWSSLGPRCGGSGHGRHECFANLVGMDERDVRIRVKSWHERARREADPTSKFVVLWFCFNAWLAYESNKDLDFEMMEWLKSEHSELRHHFDQASRETVFRRNLATLASMSPVISTGAKRRVARVESSDDFPGIVGAIYQVRCNLFHGGKRADDRRDQKLVILCGRILTKWVGNLVTSWRAAL